MSLFQIGSLDVLSQCIDIEKVYYPHMVDCLFKDGDKMEMFTVNHIARLCIQKRDIDAIRSVVSLITEKQKPSGGWGYNDGTSALIGLTSNAVQLLFWAMDALKNKDITMQSQMLDSTERGLFNILAQKQESVYWKEEEGLKRIHGLIDLNHYITLIFHYALKYERFANIRDKIRKCLDDLYVWYKEKQASDGGWHDIGKVRSRTGATADAIRALLPSQCNKESIQRGIDYLVANQNPYCGYWAWGDHDKCYDSLKALINSIWIIDRDEKYINAIVKGIGFLLTFDPKSMNTDEQCDFLAVIIDVINMQKNLYEMKEFF